MYTATPRQALLPSDLGDLCGSPYSLRLRVLPLWLACPREGDLVGHHSIQFDRT